MLKRLALALGLLTVVAASSPAASRETRPARDRIEATARTMQEWSREFAAHLETELEASGVDFDPEAIPSGVAYFAMQLYHHLDAGEDLHDAAYKAARDIFEGEIGVKLLAFMGGAGAIGVAPRALGVALRAQLAAVFARAGVGFLKLKFVALGGGMAIFRTVDAAFGVRRDDRDDAAGREARGILETNLFEPSYAELAGDAYRGGRITPGETLTEVALILAVGSALVLVGSPGIVVVGGTYAVAYLWDFLRQAYRYVRDDLLVGVEDLQRRQGRTLDRLRGRLRATPAPGGPEALGPLLRQMREPHRSLRRQVALMHNEVGAALLELVATTDQVAMFALAGDGLGALLGGDVPARHATREVQLQAPALALPGSPNGPPIDGALLPAFWSFAQVDLWRRGPQESAPWERQRRFHAHPPCDETYRSRLPTMARQLGEGLALVAAGSYAPRTLPPHSFAGSAGVERSLARIQRAHLVARHGVQVLIEYQELADELVAAHLGDAGEDDAAHAEARAQITLDDERVAALLATQHAHQSWLAEGAAQDWEARGRHAWRLALGEARGTEVAPEEMDAALAQGDASQAARCAGTSD